MNRLGFQHAGRDLRAGHWSLGLYRLRAAGRGADRDAGFDPGRCRYVSGPESRYPAYLFYASALDLARFGLLYLHEGRWRDGQIIPAAWVQESTRRYSTTTRRTGYGCLWWTLAPDGPSRVQAPPGTFWAEGNGGEIIFVVPAHGLVVVHLEREHDLSSGVSVTDSLRLMELILAARPGA